MANAGEIPAAPRHKADEAGEDFQYDGDCPFCAIASSFSPVDPLDDSKAIGQALSHEKTVPPSMVVYSGEYVLAFLDIQPMTWGHTLVIPRRHRVKMGDLEALDGAELGRHLPLIVRAVMRAVLDVPYDPENLEVEGAAYNIVQNNGPSAAQVVPHIHHHIIPRLPDTHPNAQQNSTATSTSLPHKTPNQNASWTMFGRGQRTDLNENDPETQQLVRRMRKEIAREFARGDVKSSYSTHREKQKNTSPPHARHRPQEEIALNESNSRSSSSDNNDEVSISADRSIIRPLRSLKPSL